MNQEAYYHSESFEKDPEQLIRGSLNPQFAVSDSGRTGRWIRSGPKIILLGVYSQPAQPHRPNNRQEQEVFESEVSFGDAFRKCMQTLGYPVPASLFK